MCECRLFKQVYFHEPKNQIYEKERITSSEAEDSRLIMVNVLDSVESWWINLILLNAFSQLCKQTGKSHEQCLFLP